MLGLDILDHVPDLDGTLATVARILASGGYFFSSTVCLKNMQGKLRYLALDATALPFLLTVGSISVDYLPKRMERAGSEIEEVFKQVSGVAFVVARKSG